MRLLLFFLLMFWPIAGYSGIISKKDAQDYKQCNALVAANPTQALIKAQQWMKADGSVAAYHCKAMAQFKLNDYTQAAKTLMQMHDILPAGEQSMKHQLTLQAVQAWRLSDNADEAKTLISKHILRLLDDKTRQLELAEALRVRAKLYRLAGKPHEALQDVDHALILDVPSADTLLERARIYTSMGEAALAEADVAHALANETSKNAQHSSAGSISDTQD